MNTAVNLIEKSGLLLYNYSMVMIRLPQKAVETLLQDASQRDRTTARRVRLFNVLLQERFLTREHLIARVEAVLGKGCFGDAAMEDTFYRDMKVVRDAFKSAGYNLGYSRGSKHPGYYLRGQPGLGNDLATALEGSIAEISLAQIDIYRQLSPAQRFRQGCSISDTAREVVVYRIRQRNPALSVSEAHRLALAVGNKQ